METEEISPVQLTTDLHQAIGFIKDFLILVNAQQMSLKEKARAVKNQIQDDVSLHLDHLRNREVWLLEQVDVFAQLKEESIESNREELCALLPKLEVYLEVLQTTKFGQYPEIALGVRKALLNIQYQNLNAEESSDICFFVDNFALSDAIKNFGKISEKTPDNILPRPHSGQTSVVDDTALLRKGILSCQSNGHLSSHALSSNEDLQFIQERFNAVLNSPVSEWLIPSSGSVNKNKLVKRNQRGIVHGTEEFYSNLKQSDAKEWLYRESQAVDVKTMERGFSLHFEKIKTAPLSDWVMPNPAVSRNNEVLNVTNFDAAERLNPWLLTYEFFSQTPHERNVTNEKSLSFNKEEEDEDPKGLELEKKGGKFAIGNEWVLMAHSVDQEHFLRYDMNIQDKANSQNWLHTDSSKSNVEVVTSGGLAQTSEWLMESSSEPEHCQWLTRESVSRCKSCPGTCAKDNFKVFHNVSNRRSSEWPASTTYH